MPPSAQNEALLDLVNGTAAPMVLRLCKNPIPDDAETVALGALVEADFDGYEAVDLDTFGETEREDDLIGEVLSEPCEFVADEEIEASQTIYGCYITRHPEGSPVQLMQLVRWVEPIVVGVPGQTISLQVRAMGANLV